MDDYQPSDRTSFKRLRERGTYDRSVVHSILDEALVGHLAVTTEQGPRIIPTTYARIDESVFIHGSVANYAMRAASAGGDVCFAVTILDGLVLAKSAFHHSMNYRAVIAYGEASAVTDRAQKLRALDAVVDRSLPGRSREARSPTELELRQTLVLELPLVEVAAKIRTGGPKDDQEDLDWPAWAGVIPLRLVAGGPEATVAS